MKPITKAIILSGLALMVVSIDFSKESSPVAAVSKPAPLVQIQPKPVEPTITVTPTPVIAIEVPTVSIEKPIIPSVQPAPVYSGSHEDLMAAAGIAPANYSAVDYVISHESNWRWWVVNSEGSGATGLCQALPGSKMAAAGNDWATNPVTQLKWCNDYAVGRYGSWSNAMAMGIARDTLGTGWGWW